MDWYGSVKLHSACFESMGITIQKHIRNLTMEKASDVARLKGLKIATSAVSQRVALRHIVRLKYDELRPSLRLTIQENEIVLLVGSQLR